LLKYISTAGVESKREAVKVATLEWVDRFNTGDSSSPSVILPAEAEQRYYAMLDEPAMAA
jgi:putative transposase